MLDQFREDLEGLFRKLGFRAVMTQFGGTQVQLKGPEPYSVGSG
jgi:hypothetical protein